MKVGTLISQRFACEIAKLGSTISPDDKKAIMDMFYKGDTSGLEDMISDESVSKEIRLYAKQALADFNHMHQMHKESKWS